MSKQQQKIDKIIRIYLSGDWKNMRYEFGNWKIQKDTKELLYKGWLVAFYCPYKNKARPISTYCIEKSSIQYEGVQYFLLIRNQWCVDQIEIRINNLKT